MNNQSFLKKTVAFIQADLVGRVWPQSLILLHTILEDVYEAETIAWFETINLKTTIFQCFTNYGSLTQATRLQVAPNMTDPISLYTIT